MLTNRQYAFARLDETDALITAVNNDENQSGESGFLHLATEHGKTR